MARSAVVETTLDGGTSFITRGTFAATFTEGYTLTAVVNSDGSVDVWRSFGGVSSAQNPHLEPIAHSGSWGPGGVSISLPTSRSRVDNFRGGDIG